MPSSIHTASLADSFNSRRPRRLRAKVYCVHCRQFMLEDYKEHIADLVGRYPDQLTRAQDFTFERFKIAASWVSSRAFGVDSWHGESRLTRWL